MNITWLGEDKFRIKTKKAVITTGEKVKVNDIELPGPGEYEVAGVECQGIFERVYLFEAEDLRIVYLDKIKEELTEKELEKLGDVDILIIPVGGGEVLNQTQAKNMIFNLEPKIAIPSCCGDMSAFCKESRCPPPIDILKVKKSTLGEETEIVVLRPKE
jgi:hypothetical protein